MCIAHSVRAESYFAAGLLRFLLAKKTGKSVLLLGPSGSGKTTLFLQLRDGETHNGTVASMQENAGSFVMANENVTIHGHKPSDTCI